MHSLAFRTLRLATLALASRRWGAALLLLFASPIVQAADYELLANFAQPGALPMAAPTVLPDGQRFGTTLAGGDFGMGTLYQIAPDGSITTLHSFDGADGQSPVAKLVRGSDGGLYGATEQGGAHAFGTLFKLTTTGTFSKLVDFTGATGNARGSVPNGLTAHSNGDLYGTTQAGGLNSSGTAFRLTTSGQLTTLLDFSGNAGAAPGSQPTGALALVGTELYGLTRTGGANGNGVLYKLSANGAYTQLTAFTGATGSVPGKSPRSSLLAHSDGKLYGSTEFGGTFGQGTLFKIGTDGSNFTSLHAFADSDGSKPSGQLAEAADGSIWGTTASGGAEGIGTVFSITQSGALTTRVHFTDTTGIISGASPIGGLSLGANNKLIGTASAGGPGNNGLLFEVDLAGNYTILDRFTSNLGWAPSGAPATSPQGELLFSLAFGGDAGNGTIAQILDTGTIQLKTSLSDAAGAIPNGTLSSWGSNTIGLSTRDATTGRGSVFSLAPNGTLTSLSAFTSTAGEDFQGPLLATANEAYGVSLAGGLGNNGTLFKVAADSTLTRVFSFSGTSGTRKGSRPRAPLARRDDGTLYGVTENGGSSNLGTLYKIAPDGTFSTLVEFTTTTPQHPSSGLTRAANGKLYGVSAGGGSNDLGTLYSYDPASGAIQIEVSFTGATGSAPGSDLAGTLTLGADGALYGITTAGGNGFGTAFRFQPNGGLETLASFTGQNGAAPGIAKRNAAPGVEIVGGLSLASDGKIYGALPAGGPRGGGVVFRLNLPTPLQQWKQDTLGDANASDSADPDRDGLPTLLEYMLGTEPNVSDSPNQLPFELDYSTGQPLLAISFPRIANRADLQIFVEAASSLSGPWTPIAQSDFGAPFTGSANIEESPLATGRTLTRIVQNNLNPQTSTGFLRLRITH